MDLLVKSKVPATHSRVLCFSTLLKGCNALGSCIKGQNYSGNATQNEILPERSTTLRGRGKRI